MDRDWHTQRALLNDRKLAPAAPHVLPGHDVTRTWHLAISWTDYTYDSELDIAEDVPLAFSEAAQVPGGEVEFLSCKKSTIILTAFFQLKHQSWKK